MSNHDVITGLIVLLFLIIIFREKMSILDKATIFFLIVGICQVINTTINIYKLVKEG